MHNSKPETNAEITANIHWQNHKNSELNRRTKELLDRAFRTNHVVIPPQEQNFRAKTGHWFTDH